MLTLRKGTTVSRSNRVLSYNEEKFIDEKLKQLTRERGHGELQQGVQFEPKNVKALDKKLGELKAIKNRYGAIRLSGSERVQAEKEIKMLESRIAQKWGGRVPSYSEYWMKPKDGGIKYLNLVDKIDELNRDREYSEIIRRWKYLRRSLEPENKRIDSVLHLFKQ